jgi:hypothetical protein
VKGLRTQDGTGGPLVARVMKRRAGMRATEPGVCGRLFQVHHGTALVKATGRLQAGGRWSVRRRCSRHHPAFVRAAANPSVNLDASKQRYHRRQLSAPH